MTDYEPNSSGFDPRGFGMLATAIAVLYAIGAVGILLINFPHNILLAVGVLTFGIIVYAVLRVLLAIEANTNRSVEGLRHVAKNLEQQMAVLQTVSENILLSEDAKSIAFRQKDRDALRAAIDEETKNNNWEAAFYLADQLKNRFGYRREADQIRDEIKQAQMDYRRDQMAPILTALDEFIGAHNWAEAARQIQTAQSQFPAEPEIAKLPEKLEQARAEHKKELLKQWDEMVQKNEIDKGIAVLKELDKYLTANEVAALEESARGVFRAKLHNLGVQFSMLVTEKQWGQALTVGEEIISEFPNTRMAQEIRERLDTLRANAQAQKEAK